jgi:hypothetical protein
MVVHICNLSYRREAEVGESRSETSPGQKCKTLFEKYVKQKGLVVRLKW